MNDDFPILAAVAANPAHPYALLEHLGSLGVAVTRSTLYRRVEALVGGGWLEAGDVRGGTGHYRRALKLSGEGRERVEREAREALASEPLESPLFSLAVAVAGSDAETLARLLRPRMAGAARRLTEEEHDLRTSGAAAGSLAAKQRTVAHLQADIAWLQGLMGQWLARAG